MKVFSGTGFGRAKRHCGNNLGTILKVILGLFWGAKIDDFSCYLLASFFHELFQASGSILGLYQTFREKPHPTNLPQIAVRSRVGHLKKGGNTIQKVIKIHSNNC